MILSLDLVLPAALGCVAGIGALIAMSALRGRRPDFAARVEMGRPHTGTHARAFVAENSTLITLFESLGSTRASVQRRLILLGRSPDLASFRLAQAVAAIGSLSLLALISAPLVFSRGVQGVVLVALLSGVAALAGAAAWDRLLSFRAKARQKRIDAAVPDACELLALAVGAGESIPAALERVARVSGADLGDELAITTSEIHLGAPSTRALTNLGARNDCGSLDRLCQTLITAIERGSPLARILHDQARDIRESSRQALMEEGGKKEIAMLVPVVFLILPVTILFALYPGLLALELAP